MNLSTNFDASLVRAGSRIFPYRIWVGLAFVPLGALLFRPNTMLAGHESLRIASSLLLTVSGLALRTWAGGSAGDHTRTVEIEAPRLATGGPYAYVRNPIYLGTVLIGMGMIGILGDARLLILHAIVSVLFFAMIVPCEEQFLHGKYGSEYDRYFRAVPRLIPHFRPWNGRRLQPFFWGIVRGEGVIAAVLICIYIAMRFASHLHSGR